MLDKLFGSKTTTVNQILNKDEIKKIWDKFALCDLADCEGLILIKIKDHNVSVTGSTSIGNDAYALGILEIAKMLIYKNGLCHE